MPEMAAFAERFGFRFVAHEIGDANRSARVERPFHFIENNFLAGRTFTSWEDLNSRRASGAIASTRTYKKHIRAVPRELFAVERLHLKPLPAWIPEVYRLHQRMVDIEGYVALHTNRYSVPVALIGRRVEVRETKDKIEIQLDARHIVTHRRIADAEDQRVTLPNTGRHAAEGAAARSASGRTNHPHRRAGARRLCGGPEAAQPQGDRACPAATAAAACASIRASPCWAPCGEAAQYGLYDLDRVERMILRRVHATTFCSTEGHRR